MQFDASPFRLKRFRAMLKALEGNGEVKVTGETICETVMLAMTTFSRQE